MTKGRGRARNNPGIGLAVQSRIKLRSQGKERSQRRTERLQRRDRDPETRGRGLVPGVDPRDEAMEVKAVNECLLTKMTAGHLRATRVDPKINEDQRYFVDGIFPP